MPFLSTYGSMSEALAAERENTEIRYVLGISIVDKEALVSLLIVFASMMAFCVLVTFWTCIAWSGVVHSAVMVFVWCAKHWRFLVMGKAVETIVVLVGFWVYRNWKRGRFLYKFLVF